jgi:hypothetical protein
LMLIWAGNNIAFHIEKNISENNWDSQ